MNDKESQVKGSYDRGITSYTALIIRTTQFMSYYSVEMMSVLS